ncbi:MAG: DUF1573 domain-containing protein [Chitinophagaceae bacterium]
MKKNLSVTAAVFMLSMSGLMAQSNAGSLKKETVAFSEKTFDFGKIPMGRPVTHTFTITNNGTDSLYLENVTASCGCTTPVWKKEPVAPGASTQIEVGYNAAAEGAFDKPVTIYYNKGAMAQLSVKGNVYMRNATPVPANAAVANLKQLNWK